jgi:hypothetical protein
MPTAAALMSSKRRMRRVARRTLVFAALLAALAASPAAHADLLGGDLPILSGILAEAVTEVSDLASTLANIESQVRMMQTMLSHLDPKSFAALLTLVQDATYSYSHVVGGLSPRDAQRSISSCERRDGRSVRASLTKPFQNATSP